MNKPKLKILLLLVLAVAAFAGVNAQTNNLSNKTETQKKASEPAGKFVPTEKLRADDAVAFPVDI